MTRKLQLRNGHNWSAVWPADLAEAAASAALSLPGAAGEGVKLISQTLSTSSQQLQLLQAIRPHSPRSLLSINPSRRMDYCSIRIFLIQTLWLQTDPMGSLKTVWAPPSISNCSSCSWTSKWWWNNKPQINLLELKITVTGTQCCLGWWEALPILTPSLSSCHRETKMIGAPKYDLLIRVSMNQIILCHNF